MLSDETAVEGLMSASWDMGGGGGGHLGQHLRNVN